MAERVIWERTVDQDKIDRRDARFQKFFLAPAPVVFVAALVFTGLRNAIGVALLLGLLGFAWRTTIRFRALSESANPVLVVDRGRLILGERAVILEDVKHFTTLATSIQTSLLGRYSRVHLGKALFRLDMPGSKGQPDIVEFGWPAMQEDGVASLRVALEAELPDKWVNPSDLVTEAELKKHRRQHRVSPLRSQEERPDGI